MTQAAAANQNRTRPFRNGFFIRTLCVLLTGIFALSMAVPAFAKETVSAEQKQCAEQIYQALLHDKDQIVITGKPGGGDVLPIYLEVWDRHPGLFYDSVFNDTRFEESGEGETYVCRIRPGYLRSREVEATRTVIRTLLDNAPENGTDAGKERYVHDWLVDHVTYEKDAREIPDCLLRHRCNCRAFALTMEYLLNRLGVPCRYVTGYAGGGSHAWNVVTLDGKSYATDACWDASDPNPYRYYNLPASEMEKSHHPEDPSAMADCRFHDQEIAGTWKLF